MALYETLSKINIVGPIRGRFKMDLEGKIPVHQTMDLNTPWINNGVDRDRKCLLWLQTFFKYYAVLPKGCLDCWKIYYFPESLSELMEILQFQQEDSRTFIDIPCKCGMEVRPFTSRLGGYASFWYNPLGCGLTQARKNAHTLSEALGKKLLLKRGCTEMEHYTRRAFGKGSDEWEDVRNRTMQMREDLLESTFYLEGWVPDKLPTAVEVDVQQRWIEHAAEHGDMTYLKFVNEPFFPKIEQYVGSIHNSKDFPGGDYGTDNNESEQRGTEEPARIETLEEI